MCWRVLSLVAVLSSAWAAERSSVSGSVEDPSGGALPGALVVAMNEETGVRYRGRTSADGVYVLTGVFPGHYKITASRHGFRTSARLHVQVVPAESARIDFVLPVGGVRHGVTVEDDPLSPGVGDPTDSMSAGSEWLETLPLNGRGIVGLLELAPGIVMTPASAGEAGQFSVNGQRPNANYFLVDGVSSNSGTGGGSPAQFAGGALPGMTAFGGTQSLVSLHAVAEVRVETSAFAPEFGRMPGAQISVTTRSGSDDLHGSLFHQFRHESLNAGDWIANSSGLGRQPARLNQWGGAFGGPLIPGRTYFFASYEGLNLAHSSTARLPTPSMDARSRAEGDLASLLEAFPAASQSNGPGAAIAYAARSTQRAASNTGAIRIDHSLTPGISLFARYQQSPSWSQSGFRHTEHSSFGSHRLTTGATAILGRGLTNDLRFSYSGSGVTTEWRGNSLEVLRNRPDLVPPGATHTLYALAIGDIGEVMSGQSGRHRQRQMSLHNVVALNRGHHEYRFGLDYERLTPERLDATASIAAYYPTLAGALAGEAPLWPRTLAEAASSVISSWSLFAQDTWRITPRLSLIYGTRWELTPAPSLRLAQAQPAFASFGSTVMTAEIVGPPGSSGGTLWPTRATQFAPRVGIAYRLTDTSALRASWGMFYHAGFSAAADAINGFPFNRWQLSTGGLASARTFSSLGGYSFPHDLKMPRVQHWNVTLETALNASSIASIAYAGSAGRRLLRREGAIASPELLSNLGGSFVQDRLASGIAATNNGASDYHALQARYRLRMRQGLQASAAYTWSHSIDNGSWDSGVSLVDPNRGVTAMRDRGSSTFDARHAFHAALSHDLATVPLGQLWRKATTGWTLQSLARARTGFPMDVRTSANRLGLGFDNMTRPNWNAGIPVWLNDPSAPGGRRLNPEAFTAPADGVQGTLGRNAIRGFGMWSVDFSLMRTFAMSDRGRLELRAEAFNAFNAPSFADPVTFLDDVRFGQSASMLNLMLGTGTPRSGLTPAFQTGGPRLVQFTLRWQF